MPMGLIKETCLLLENQTTEGVLKWMKLTGWLNRNKKSVDDIWTL